MILKISDGNGGWTLFDNVEQVYFAQSDPLSKTQEDLDNVKEVGILNLISRSCFNLSKVIDVMLIRFERHGIEKKAWVTDKVFVCDDAGNTFDRMYVTKNHKK